MKYRLIGDIHGDFTTYESIISDSERSIQVGDFGVGFFSDKTTIYTPEIEKKNWYGPLFEENYKEEPNLNHRFIRGNHDNPEACKQNKLWIPDGTMHGPFFCIGGALSIDKDYRREDYDYWSDEELTYDQFMKIADSYEKIKPNFVISHDCPESVTPHLFSWYNKTRFPSITRQGLQMLFEIHQPKLWVFGHWHHHKMEVIRGTQFICLDINQSVDIDIQE